MNKYLKNTIRHIIRGLSLSFADFICNEIVKNIENSNKRLIKPLSNSIKK